MLFTMLLVALTGTSLIEHDHVKPLPGSRVVVDDERDGELVVTYRDAGSRVRRSIAGRVYSIEYETSRDVTAEEVVQFFTEQAEGLDGGYVHRTTENRLTFSFRRPDGGTTWCQIWSTDGNYTLELVDEAAGAVAEASEVDVDEPAPASESDDVVGRLVFDAATDALPPGAGGVLDDVATRLNHAPASRLEIRSSGDRGLRNAETVRSALVLFGIGNERMTIVSADDGDDVSHVELVLLPQF